MKNKNAYVPTSLSQTIGAAVAVLALALTLLAGPSFEAFADSIQSDYATQLDGAIANNGGTSDPTGG